MWTSKNLWGFAWNDCVQELWRDSGLPSPLDAKRSTRGYTAIFNNITSSLVPKNDAASLCWGEKRHHRMSGVRTPCTITARPNARASKGEWGVCQFPRMRSGICSHTDVRYAPRVLHFSAFHYIILCPVQWNSEGHPVSDRPTELWPQLHGDDPGQGPRGHLSALKHHQQLQTTTGTG